MLGHGQQRTAGQLAHCSSNSPSGHQPGEITLGHDSIAPPWIALRINAEIHHHGVTHRFAHQAGRLGQASTCGDRMQAVLDQGVDPA